VVKALVAANSPTPKFQILALTRNPESGSAKALAEKPKVTVIQGDLDDPKAIFEKAGGAGAVWGVFSVQVIMGGKATFKTEEVQGKALADAALEYGVKFFVYSSVDRGGDKSDANDTNVPHFISKARIERKVKEIGEKGVGWTILRPVAFFDNATPDFGGSVFGTLWKTYVSSQKKLQLVATTDIGDFVALAFQNPEEWNGKSLSLAGDSLTFLEADAIFRETFNKPFPTTYSIFAYGIGWLAKDIYLMFQFFDKEGYGANIAELKTTYPNLKDFKTWLREESAFKSE